MATPGNGPVSDYGRSKLLAEHEALRFRDRFPVVILRPSAVYGPRDTDVLELFQSLDVGLQDLAPRAGARRRDRVGRVDEHGLDRPRLVVAMVTLHGVDDGLGLAVLLQDLPAQLQGAALAKGFGDLDQTVRVLEDPLVVRLEREGRLRKAKTPLPAWDR